MLTFSRTVGERVVVGEPGPNQVVFTIVEIAGNKVKVGINAEREIPVHRGEIYRRAFGEDSFEAQGFGGR